MAEDTVFQIRLSKERKAAYVKAAGKLALASWIKMILDDAAIVPIKEQVTKEPVITKKPFWSNPKKA